MNKYLKDFAVLKYVLMRYCVDNCIKEIMAFSSLISSEFSSLRIFRTILGFCERGRIKEVKLKSKYFVKLRHQVIQVDAMEHRCVRKYEKTIKMTEMLQKHCTRDD